MNFCDFLFGKIPDQISVVWTTESVRNDSANRAGSALLVTIILMAVLMIAGLGFHGLILNSIRLSHNSISAGKAYFHAEAGIEEALLRIESNLPGYEIRGEKGDANDDGKNDFQFSIPSLSSSAGGSVPCDFDLKGKPWGTLSLNESVAFPLFRDNGSGGEEKILQFTVEYQLDSPSSDPVDALSWKIFGLTPTNDTTEAMSGYLQAEKNKGSSFNEASEANFQTCIEGGLCSFDENYEISKFLKNHRNNYLVLTNLINIPETTIVNPDDYKLSFRLIERGGDALVCDTIRIEADGSASDIDSAEDRYRQNLNAELRLEDFLPVFDFALYRTAPSIGSE
ncbi:pilus assembly PilX N-terminal domain-containing protein [Candidatus Peregrinibacteria bacterium]|nr:pilus assembly PilX N-terminal domain-containing protein [Candidatus Peregrinibacteria bacterium]